MKRVAHLLLAVCTLSSVVYSQAVAFDYSKLYEALSPAVVQVTTQDGSGSGFLVTPFGHIATNFHVIRGSRYYEFLMGDEFKMQIIDARNPNSVHKELIFRSDSKSIKQLRADFTFAPAVVITTAP